MKNIFKALALMLITAVTLTACEERVLQTDAVANYASINSGTLSLIPNETGSVNAYIGDEVTAQGINLEYVSRVEFYHSSTQTRAEAEITILEHELIGFIIPYFDFAQSDYVYPVSLYVYDQNYSDEDPVFSYSYYITVPITDVLIDETEPIAPASGTIGDQITITGRNLGQVSAITFGENTIAEADFVEHLAESITFAIPVASYAAGTSSLAVSVTWNGSTKTTVTEEFAMRIPSFDAYVAPSVAPTLSEQIVLKGENLDLVSNYAWGEYSFSVVESTEEEVTLQIPAIMDIDNAADVNITKDITAVYGAPDQAITAASSVTVNTTKLVGSVPEVTAISGKYGEKYYLGGEVTLSGSCLSLIEAVTVGGADCTLVSQTDDTYIFTVGYSDVMPFDQTSSVTVDDVDYTFDTATSMEIVLSYDGGTTVPAGNIAVYPMYYYEDVCLGLGTTSSSAYTEYGHDNAFFMLNTGRVLSATEWYDEGVDPYALSGSNTMISSANTINTTSADATAENYYGVEPYIMINSNSSGKISLCSAANSSSVLKCHRYISGDSYTALPSAYGTPIWGFRNITDATDDAYAAIMDGTLETINEKNDTSSAVPALTTAGSEQASTSTWGINSVMYFAYSTFTFGAPKPNPAAEGRRIGYIHIKEVTLADLTTGLTDADNADYNAGYVKMDIYVSAPRLLDL